jgi:hypothetical protein
VLIIITTAEALASPPPPPTVGGWRIGGEREKCTHKGSSLLRGGYTLVVAGAARLLPLFGEYNDGFLCTDDAVRRASNSSLNTSSFVPAIRVVVGWWLVGGGEDVKVRTHKPISPPRPSY